MPIIVGVIGKRHPKGKWLAGLDAIEGRVGGNEHPKTGCPTIMDAAGRCGCMVCSAALV